MPKVVALLLIIAGLGPGELPEYAPAGDEAYTLDLEIDGYVNGYMDPDRLMTVRGCTLERDAAYTYSLMLDAAEEDGLSLRHESCYRTYAQQRRAYNRRCPYQQVPVYSDHGVSGGQQQLGSKKVRVCTGPPVAPAGESNHGWGRAVDFKDGGGTLSCYDREFLWLQGNAHRFGWVHPGWARCGKAKAEPWHWEFAGVTDPTLVDFVTIDPALIATAE